MTWSPYLRLGKPINRPGLLSASQTWAVMTELPFQVGYAEPSNQPASLLSQVTSQPSLVWGTPTMDILTPSFGISSQRSVDAYTLSAGWMGNVVILFCGKPVAGIKLVG